MESATILKFNNPVESFLQNYKSPATRRAYRKIIDEYSGLSDKNILEKLRTPRERSILKTYFRFIGRNYEFMFRKVLRNKYPKLSGEIGYLEAKIAILGNDFTNQQRVALGLMLFCGLRVSEVVSTKLRVRDGMLIIHGKGNKTRRVPVPDFMLKQLRTVDKIDVTDMTVRRWVYKLGEITGKKVYPHFLRKLYATRISENINIATVSKLLGHSNPATTMKYIVDVSRREMDKAMEVL